MRVKRLAINGWSTVYHMFEHTKNLHQCYINMHDFAFLLDGDYYFANFFRIACISVDIHADSIAVSQRMGGDPTTNHKIGLDIAHVNLDTILCFSCCPLRLESSKWCRNSIEFLYIEN